MKTKYTEESKIITCNFCPHIVMVIPKNSQVEIYDYETMMICAGCRTNTVGEWK